MNITIESAGRRYEADLGEPLDISLAIDNTKSGPNAFYADRPAFEPYRSGDFIASVREGGSVNSYDVRFNPHGNGTHTECLGHITAGWQKITDVSGDTHHFAHLISVMPESLDGDRIITPDILVKALEGHQQEAKALVIRTLPNEESKKDRQYSGQNPPYLHPSAMMEIVRRGYEHLLIDLPSVDREEDGGKVAAHHIFWGLPEQKGREHCTITELVFVPGNIRDGFYLIDIQRASFHLDCSPSRPVLYRLREIID